MRNDLHSDGTGLLDDTSRKGTALIADVTFLGILGRVSSEEPRRIREAPRTDSSRTRFFTLGRISGEKTPFALMDTQIRGFFFVVCGV